MPINDIFTTRYDFSFQKHYFDKIQVKDLYQLQKENIEYISCYNYIIQCILILM